MLPYTYFYCFFRGHLPFAPQEGIDEANATFVLSYRCLSALVSSVPRHEYSEEALRQRLQDLEWLTPRVKRHEEIIRYVMELHPVIPVRFGVIYSSHEKVLEVMRSGYDELCSHLDFISDKEEWGIKIYAEEEAGRKAIEAASEPIRQLDEKISSSVPAGQAYLLGKKKENLIRQKRADFLNSLSVGIYEQMSSWSIEARANKLLSRRATGKEVDMILNAALLLSKSEVEAFREKVDALAAKYGPDGLYFEISGPWPCYNFCPDFAL